MLPVVTELMVEEAIRADSPVVVGVSGGKDSQAAVLATFAYLDRLGHGGPRLLIHADLGSVEWKDSLRVCEDLAAHFGVELMVVQRNAGGLMERWEARWQSSQRRYEELSTVTLVPCWSTPSMRFCTSELKTHVIRAAVRARFKNQTIINVTGIRRAESSKRAKSTVADQEPKYAIINWRPILDWTETDVFSAIDASGLAPHPAYRKFGMTRVSCRFCIMSSLPDMNAAAAQPESHDLYRRMVSLECASSFGFQGARWLGDIAPQLLDDDLRERLLVAKSMAVWRTQAESRITRSMLYVDGWPTRMLTDTEADILASVRTEVSAIFGFRAECLDRNDIHRRYAELMARKEAA